MGNDETENQSNYIFTCTMYVLGNSLSLLIIPGGNYVLSLLSLFDYYYLRQVVERVLTYVAYVRNPCAYSLDFESIKEICMQFHCKIAYSILPLIMISLKRKQVQIK